MQGVYGNIYENQKCLIYKSTTLNFFEITIRPSDVGANSGTVGLREKRVNNTYTTKHTLLKNN